MEETKSQVDRALARLETAVAAIEERAEARDRDLRQRLEAAHQEAASAKSETERLRQEAAAMARLLETTQERLDKAIERLQGLLTQAVEA